MHARRTIRSASGSIWGAGRLLAASRGRLRRRLRRAARGGSCRWGHYSNAAKRRRGRFTSFSPQRRFVRPTLVERRAKIGGHPRRGSSGCPPTHHLPCGERRSAGERMVRATSNSITPKGVPPGSTPTASVEPSLYFETGSRAIVPARRIGYLENKVRRKNFGVHAFLQYVLTRGLVGLAEWRDKIWRPARGAVGHIGIRIQRGILNSPISIRISACPG